MAKTREIKKRIKAVGNIRRITKTMQMIATSKFAKAQQAAVASKPYTETLFNLVADLSASAGDFTHPLMGNPGGKGAAAGKGKAASGQPLTLIITSDRGLCGAYNSNVLRTAMGFLRSDPAAKAGRIELVGKKGQSFLKFQGVPVARQHAFGDKPSYETVRALADEYMAMFARGEASAVRVVYMRYISAGKQTPTVLQLLPFDAKAAEQAGKQQSVAQARTDAQEAAKTAAPAYEFSPGAAELMGELLPAAVKAVLFQVFNDAIVSEHVARMIAMKSATDNAGKAGKALSRKFNRARQSQITTELTEIISGAAALE
jgi:F-type H+-transporting ATPase subunit gamma